MTIIAELETGMASSRACISYPHRWNEAFDRTIFRTSDFSVTSTMNSGDKNKQIATRKRKTINYQSLEPLNVYYSRPYRFFSE